MISWIDNSHFDSRGVELEFFAFFNFKSKLVRVSFLHPFVFVSDLWVQLKTRDSDIIKELCLVHNLQHFNIFGKVINFIRRQH